MNLEFKEPNKFRIYKINLFEMEEKLIKYTGL